MDGTYTIKFTTPLGPQQMDLTLATDGNTLNGKAVTNTDTIEFRDGSRNGVAFDFIIEMITPMGKMKTKTSGTVEGNKISGVMKTPLGKMTFSGTKIS